MMASSIVLLLSAFFFIIRETTLGYDDYIVFLESSCNTSNACLTLSDYESETNVEFISNAIYLLAEGQHEVYGQLNLRNVQNITFRGNNSIILLGPTANITISNSDFIEFRDIVMENLDEANFSIMSSIYLIIHASHYLTIINVNFMYINLYDCFSQFLDISDSNICLAGCIFQSGYSKNGGAIVASNSNLTFSGFTRFDNNTALSMGGGIYARDCTLNFTGTSTFMANNANKGGAMYLQNSLVILTRAINFIRNEGKLGGALFLNRAAQILFKPTTILSFVKNNAEKGGAVYILDSCKTFICQCYYMSITKPINCFFKVETFLNDTSPQLNFEGNSANINGGDIFGGFLETCRVQVNDVSRNTSGYDYLDQLSAFKNSSNNSYYISSKAFKICQCNMDGNPNCTNNRKNMEISPGKNLDISVVPVGQLNLPVSAFISSIVDSTYAAEVLPEIHNYDVSTSKCYNLRFKVLMSEMEDNFTVSLYPAECVGPSSSLSLKIKKKDCPLGFQHIGNTCTCDENLADLKIGNETCVTECDIERGKIKVPKNIWINRSENQFQCGHCPLAYCHKEPVWIDLSLSPDSQCENNRGGTLCGGCLRNYSLRLNRLDCHNCDNNNYLSLLVFFFLAPIVLIVILLLLQMTVAHGTVNGLILYCNVIGICTNSFWPPNQEAQPPLPVFIAWVNLNFGITACFYDRLNHYVYTWLQLAFPFYLWFLIGLIVLGCKLSSRIAKIFGSNPVAVLATIILMSFTKLLQTAEQALSYKMLNSTNRNSTNSNSTNSELTITWGMDPNLNYMKGRHLALTVILIAIIIFLLLPYTILLTFGYHLQKYSGKKGFRWFNCFKPLLDAYYAPYKKKKRYWTGLLLLIRSCFFLTLPFLTESNAVLVTISSLFSILMAFSWLTGRIYNNFYVEILEASFVVNLCLLSVTSCYVKKVSNDKQLPVTYAFTGVAFAEFIGILFYHIVLSVCQKINPDFQFNCANVISVLCFKKKTKNDSSFIAEVSNKTTMMVHLREPLLDDSTEV